MVGAAFVMGLLYIHFELMMSSQVVDGANGGACPLT